MSECIRDIVSAELDELEHSDAIRQPAYATSRPGHPDEGITVTLHLTQAETERLTAYAKGYPVAMAIRQLVLHTIGAPS